MKHMKERYEELELDAVKEQIIRHCSFSLGKQKIRQLSPRFEELWVRRELTRTQEALTLVYRYGNLPFQGAVSYTHLDVYKRQKLSFYSMANV